MGIQNTLNYEMAMRANAKHQVTLQCLSYHCSASLGAARRLNRRRLPRLELRPFHQWYKSNVPEHLNSSNRFELESSTGSSTLPIFMDDTALPTRFESNSRVRIAGRRLSAVHVTPEPEEPDRRHLYFEMSTSDGVPICRLPVVGVDEHFFRGEPSLLVGLGFFRDLDLIRRFQIPYLTLCRWLLSIQKSYRNVCYHNWRHAFEVGTSCIHNSAF
jgi:hypothetical protein